MKNEHEIERIAVDVLTALQLPHTVFSVHMESGQWCIKLSTPNEVMALQLEVPLGTEEEIKKTIKRQLQRTVHKRN